MTAYTADSLPPCPDCGKPLRLRGRTLDSPPVEGTWLYECTDQLCPMSSPQKGIESPCGPLTVATAPWTRDLWAEVERARAERDAMGAELAGIRAAAQPVEAQKPALVWTGTEANLWALSKPGGSWASGAYIAYRWGTAGAYLGGGALSERSERLPCIQDAVRQIATWARDDGYYVPPHPLGWDTGEEAPNG